MVTRSILVAAALAAGLVSGCATTEHQAEQAAQVITSEQWDFYAYRVVEGQGQVFSGTGKSYVILPGGVNAKAVKAPGNPLWSQEGAVVAIAGQPPRIEVIGDGAIRVIAELVSQQGEARSLPDGTPASHGTQPAITAPLNAECRTGTPCPDSKTVAVNQKIGA